MVTGRFIGRRKSLLTLVGVFLICMSVLVVVGQTAAQKSKKVQTSPVAQNTLKDFLSRYQGQTTNLGVLKEVAGDYFIVEEESATALHPLSAIQAFRILKPEEGVSTLLEIKLVAKD